MNQISYKTQSSSSIRQRKMCAHIFHMQMIPTAKRTAMFALNMEAGSDT